MSPPLEIADGLQLSDAHRALLRPGELVTGTDGHAHRLPRFFYVVESWQQARDTRLTAHFTLSELMSVDCREAPLLLREFPHYVPCAVSILARYLEEFRERAGAPVMVAVNGGYRSPAHRFSAPGSLHLWATAADLYRVGDTLLDDAKSIDRYARLAAAIGQEVRVKPSGHGPGETDDHLHFDLGYVTLASRSLDET